ncbi:hypothetical protein GCM10009662_84850 [Catellatospora coxensis]|uniref:Helix-turn-helix domain-containing protein n=1 Tax=Catellatospora coxensis TaxID=310354 RepID=A0A8J3L4H0_9ACTN|nr:hypothetical protein Cco03nite_83230 [Catellatospora coxensis]
MIPRQPARASTALAERPADRPAPKALYKIPEVMTLLSMSRSVIYEQIRAGRLRSVTQGRARLVSAAAIADYVTLLENETMRSNA